MVELFGRNRSRRQIGERTGALQQVAGIELLEHADGPGRGVRVPALDLLFPPGSVDHETRPYQAGWLLYAYPRARGSRW